ncbi:hypothetical protein KFL_002420100 [Klebsormidium nitens]|uniref:Uncharacterized protein n=1 Tax=Klebsormidium nitens TaxID=105231 RepID=A0A1Y1IA56_KLENI|nr:hypothetical protein KFL_002420100 [Klebsormidium nitens]|eukprot:GAQ85576.1 hypothetical protein KFL_002420100 [Klebsormidium nitens]
MQAAQPGAVAFPQGVVPGGMPSQQTDEREQLGQAFVDASHTAAPELGMQGQFAGIEQSLWNQITQLVGSEAGEMLRGSLLLSPNQEAVRKFLLAGGVAQTPTQQGEIQGDQPSMQWQAGCGAQEPPSAFPMQDVPFEPSSGAGTGSQEASLSAWELGGPPTDAVTSGEAVTSEKHLERQNAFRIPFGGHTFDSEAVPQPLHLEPLSPDGRSPENTQAVKTFQEGQQWVNLQSGQETVRQGMGGHFANVASTQDPINVQSMPSPKTASKGDATCGPQGEVSPLAALLRTFIATGFERQPSESAPQGGAFGFTPPAPSKGFPAQTFPAQKQPGGQPSVLGELGTKQSEEARNMPQENILPEQVLSGVFSGQPLPNPNGGFPRDPSQGGSQQYQPGQFSGWQSLAGQPPGEQNVTGGRQTVEALGGQGPTGGRTPVGGQFSFGGPFSRGGEFPGSEQIPVGQDGEKSRIGFQNDQRQSGNVENAGLPSGHFLSAGSSGGQFAGAYLQAGGATSQAPFPGGSSPSGQIPRTPGAFPSGQPPQIFNEAPLQTPFPPAFAASNPDTQLGGPFTPSQQPTPQRVPASGPTELYPAPKAPTQIVHQHFQPAQSVPANPNLLSPISLPAARGPLPDMRRGPLFSQMQAPPFFPGQVNLYPGQVNPAGPAAQGPIRAQFAFATPFQNAFRPSGYQSAQFPVPGPSPQFFPRGQRPATFRRPASVPPNVPSFRPGERFRPSGPLPPQNVAYRGTTWRSDGWTPRFGPPGGGFGRGAPRGGRGWRGGSRFRVPDRGNQPERPAYGPRPRYVPYVRSDVLLRQRMTFEHVPRKRQHEEEEAARDEKRAHAPDEKNKDEISLESSAESVQKDKNRGGSAESGVVEKAKDEDREREEPGKQEERGASELPGKEDRVVPKRTHVRFSEEQGGAETAEEQNGTAGEAEGEPVQSPAVVNAVPGRGGHETGKKAVAFTERSELTRNGQERNADPTGTRNAGSGQRAEGALPGAPPVQNAVSNALPRPMQPQFQKAANRYMSQRGKVGVDGAAADAHMPQRNKAAGAAVTSYTGQVLEAAALLGAI